MKNRGLLIIISGPSGAGKGTVLKRLCSMNKNLRVSVSCTTRAPRKGEVEGKSYFFISEEEFTKRVREDDFFEYAVVFGKAAYGTPMEQINLRDQGLDVILEIDVQGAMKAKRKASDALMIFIAPPSLEELRRRLEQRGTEKWEDVERRLATAVEELRAQDQYDYVVINDEVQRAAEEILAIIKKEKQKRS